MPVAEAKSGAERVQEFLGGKVPRTGAELVKALKLSGTPDEALVAARKCLADACEEDRGATAPEVLAAMEAADEDGRNEGTLSKARRLVATGKVRTPERAAVPIEEQILSAKK